MLTLGFGGGCHWCTEAVFQALAGVHAVRQGFIRSVAPDEAWSEAVEVDFDPRQIGLRDLVGVHLATHASASHHKMRGKYRSAVYTSGPDLQAKCRSTIVTLKDELQVPFITRVLSHEGFKPSDPRFHDYYFNGPERPFCRTYIEPKLTILRKRYTQLLQAGHTDT